MSVEKIAQAARNQKTTLKGLILSQADPKEINAAAKEYIRLSYAWQEARFGCIKTKLSVSHILRNSQWL